MTADRKLSVQDKLNILIKKGTGHLEPPQPKTHYEIDSVVTGDFCATPLGDVFFAEQTYLTDYHHGVSPIQSPLPFSLISQWANDPRLVEIPLSKFAFLDTETSGLAGGTGTYAFLVGIARFVDGQFVLRQFFMRDPAEEPAMLEAVAQFLAPAQALVTFNGKGDWMGEASW